MAIVLDSPCREVGVQCSPRTLELGSCDIDGGGVRSPGLGPQGPLLVVKGLSAASAVPGALRGQLVGSGSRPVGRGALGIGVASSVSASIPHEVGGRVGLGTPGRQAIVCSRHKVALGRASVCKDFIKDVLTSTRPIGQASADCINNVSAAKRHSRHSSHGCNINDVPKQDSTIGGPTTDPSVRDRWTLRTPVMRKERGGIDRSRGRANPVAARPSHGISRSLPVHT